MLSILEAAQIVHAAGADQLTHESHQTGAADALGSAAADHAQMERAGAIDNHILYGAVESGHAAGDGAAFECGARGTGRGQNPAPVADDQLGVGTDIHDRDRTLFMG